MMRRIIVVVLFPMMLFILPLSTSHADNAEVLPKGISRASINSTFFFPIDERFDDDGHTEDIAADYNAVLNSIVFPALALLETPLSAPPFGGLPAGTANVGSSVVDFELDIYGFEFCYQYGLTDRLSIGIKVPYLYQKNDVDSRLDTNNANVGKSALANSLVRLDAPLPDVQPLTKQDILDLLGKGLDINGDGTVEILGYQFKDFDNWSDSGVGDIELGFRYQYLKTKDWRLAFTGGVRFPTGEVDDEDDLVDRGFGDGAYACLFRLNNDYIGIKNLVLNATFRYDLILPEREKLRVIEDANHPITTNKEKVDRDLGDIVDLEVSATYQFLKELSGSILYDYRFKFEDDVSGNMGYMYSGLEDETRTSQHVIKFGLAYNTISLYKEKKFPLPITAGISYRYKFAGRNNALKSEYMGLDLAVYF